MSKRMKVVLSITGIVILVITGVLVWFVTRYHRTSSKRMVDKYEGTIEAVKSTVDQDGDGIDDQTDILESGLEYIDTHPKYKSAYYAGGYSNDEYGVCTDVVANALLGAGYDLYELVSKDIEENPEDYPINAPDPNIDFRRVKNLKVYFDHTAISLTLDPRDIDEWQGGDIVVWERHIGLVSDRRNKDGVCYVIHHANPYQTRYEQDVLENFGQKIIGHYRISE